MVAPNRILIVKISSLGDVIHNFPMVSDIQAEFPSCQIDWLVEEAYVPLVNMHQSVHRIIPISLRRWRKSIFSFSTWRELKQCLNEIRKYPYDLIIDSQGLIKSALFAKLARGTTYGFGMKSVREKLASVTYDISLDPPSNQHMLERCRGLASLILGYDHPVKINYSLTEQTTSKLKTNEVLILCSSAQSKKIWPSKNWIQICNYLASSGLECKFVWGDPRDRKICEEITASAGGEILPRMQIDDIASVIQRSRLVIGLDTGLLHLAAAMETPLISIFGASDPEKTGPRGGGMIKICGSKNHFPSAEEVTSTAKVLINS